LDDLIEEMSRSVTYWLQACYRANNPEVALLAQDELPATALRRAVNRLKRRWQRRFNQLALDLAAYFAQETAKRSDAALRRSLAKGGMTVEFKMTAAMRDSLNAIVEENVGLIRSIPSRYFEEIGGAVMRSVAAGRDMGPLAETLQTQFGVAKRRAALISRDQNNKATANLQRIRSMEVGIREAVWVHSAGGKVPRPSHVKAGRDKVRFDLSTGWWDPVEEDWVFPGSLINCRCVSRPVVAGFNI
jgi:uncharacterized protein with gpF-like domain